MLLIKKVIIYGVMLDKVDDILQEMQAFITKHNWQLVEAIFDYEGSCEGLFKLSERLEDINLILIYDKDHISDEFSSEFLYKIAQSEKIEIIDLRLCKDT